MGWRWWCWVLVLVLVLELVLVLVLVELMVLVLALVLEFVLELVAVLASPSPPSDDNILRSTSLGVRAEHLSPSTEPPARPARGAACGDENESQAKINKCKDHPVHVIINRLQVTVHSSIHPDRHIR